jgi:short-subunit dehydrogenase
MENYNDKTIWIIGASTGIGKALAQNLNAQGADLILSARSEDGLKKLNDELGGQHTVLPVDVSDNEALKKATSSFKKLHSVVHLAAIYDPTSLNDLTHDTMSKIIDVNLKGTFNVIEATLPILKKQGYGQLALCGSVAGYRGLPNGQPYSATKAAVINLAESLRAEEQKNGLDIRLISPGFVETPMTAKNDFDMPMAIKPEEAADAIAKGLLSNSYEIHFPKKFTFIMKFLQLLPAWLYFKIAHKMSR